MKKEKKFRYLIGQVSGSSFGAPTKSRIVQFSGRRISNNKSVQILQAIIEKGIEDFNFENKKKGCVMRIT